MTGGEGPEPDSILDREATHEDAARAGDLFAGTPAGVRPRQGVPLATLLASLVLSDAFAAALTLKDGRLVVGDAMLAPLEPSLLRWVSAIAAMEPDGAGRPLDRLDAVSWLLRHHRVRQALVDADPACREVIDALVAALTELDNAVRTIAASTLFDVGHYRLQLPAGLEVACPAMHYVLRGEPYGLMPSAGFDPRLYGQVNPDVAAAGINRLVHFEQFGRREGRDLRPWWIDHPLPPVAGAERPTILLLLHEATYTGAPILGWNLARALNNRYRVVVVLRRGGALEAALRNVAAAVVPAPPPAALSQEAEMRSLADRLLATYRPLYIIANSVESAPLALALRASGGAIVGLVHEFWPGRAPTARLPFYACCAALVFPTRLVERSSLHAFAETGMQRRFILPQGPSAVPPFGPGHRPSADAVPPFSPGRADDLAGGRPTHGAARPFTVIGLGAVDQRKGVDLFVATATALLARHPGINCRFVWVGTWEHAVGTNYGMYLVEQCARSGLGDRLQFIPPVDDLEPVYRQADILLLSSRLDPLPNVAIDAAMRGLPVVCFAEASGMAEILAAEPNTAALVVPHLDSGAAAEQIAALAGDAAYCMSAGEAIRALGRRTFDLSAYADALDAIGQGAARRRARVADDLRSICRADAFDPDLFFGDDSPPLPDTGAARRYLHDTLHINFAAPPVPRLQLRRPLAGFHPPIYATEAADFPRDGSCDPLAHYLEAGRPQGRWTHCVLRPDVAPLPVPHRTASRHPPLSTLLHAQLQGTDAIGALIAAVVANRDPIDLLITVPATVPPDLLRGVVEAYPGVKIEVDQVTSGPAQSFVRLLRAGRFDGYDLVGHVHEASAGAGSAAPQGVAWRHLVGPCYPVVDFVVDAALNDPSLGMVFREDAAVAARNIADPQRVALLRLLGLEGRLPLYGEAPTDGMFWIRRAALRRLSEGGSGTGDTFPTIDARSFAMVLSLLCVEEGYGYAATYIRDVTPH